MNTQITYEQAVKSVQAIRQLHDETAAFLNIQGLEPRTDSLAARELKNFARPESLITAYSQGTSLMEVAADHLVALTRTLVEPAQAVAPWTMARAVLESSALSYWLLDIKITAPIRVRRSLALRYEGLIQQAKFSQASDLSAETTKVNARIEEIELIAENLGFAKLCTSEGKRTGIGQVMPSVTEIIRDTLKEEAQYRLFSAMAHAHHWAFNQLSFRKVGETDFQANKALLMEKNLPVEVVLWLCSNVARYFAQPVKLQCELYGWDSIALNALLDDVFRKIGIHPNSELWHTRQNNAG